ncbi:enoyl-CoA hydratase [Nannocystaceae bacterium ST9]
MPASEPSENLQVHHDQGVCTIVFDRPAKKNAFTQAMYVGFLAAIEQARTDAGTRVVLLHGAGGVFTAGNDLGDFANNPPIGKAAERDESGLPRHPLLRLLHVLPRFEKPLVAAVQGSAVGIGVTMLLHCDLVYSGEGARFSLPFVNLGLSPEAGSSLLLPKLMGHQRAAELLLLAEPFSAATAREYGLVNQVLADDAVIDRARTIARTLARKPAASLRASKQLMRAPYAAQLEQVIDREVEVFAQRLVSPEAREAFEAFLSKREPNFGKFE